MRSRPSVEVVQRRRLQQRTQRGAGRCCGGCSRGCRGGWDLVVSPALCGAALSILTGNGKQVDGESYLGFDGKYIMPNATPVYLHKSTSTDSR